MLFLIDFTFTVLEVGKKLNRSENTQHFNRIRYMSLKFWPQLSEQAIYLTWAQMLTRVFVYIAVLRQ